MVFWIKSTRNVSSRILVAAIALQWLATARVLAVNGRDAAMGREAMTAQQGGQPAGLPNGQVTAAQQARNQGIEVRLRGGWETRIKIRGKNLGQRRSFSGGKGLVPQRAGGYAQDAVAVLDNLSRIIGAKDSEKEISARNVAADALGFHHARIRQLHHGLKVVGGDLIVHFNAADLPYQVTGSYVPGIGIGTLPGIDAATAQQLALKDLANLGKEPDRLEQPPTLVVFARGRAPVLAYELALSTPAASGRAPGLWRYWIDAETGRVVSRYNDIKDIAPPTANGSNAPVSGNILAGEGGGVQSVGGWHESTGGYYLYNKDRKWFIYNDSVSASYPDANTYAYRTVDDWTDSDRVEMSAAINFDATQDYYKSTHSRDSYDNANAYARANVHEGDSYANAFWSSSKQQFFFGDGDGSTANSLAVLDVVAHEFTHAVTEHTADLVYSYEPGALNESFSDIFGACVEFATQPDGRSFYPSSQPGKADWLIGEDCWLSSPALRDMRNPRNASTVGSSGVQPSRYFGENWYSGSGDNGGVHINSGVQNFFFYLLCEGGSGSNDGINYSLTGIGIANAEAVAYRALTVYTTPSTDYRDVREAWLDAATDLNPSWVPAVDAAWLACGMSALEILPNSSVAFAGKQGGAFDPWRHGFELQNHASSAVEWTAGTTQPWLAVTPASGTLAAGATTTAYVKLTPAAEALAKGIYIGDVNFQTATGTLLGSRKVLLKVGQPDYLTEQFTSSDFDLDGMSITFTPDGSDSYYKANALPITALPVDFSAHTQVYLADDAYYQIPELGGGAAVKLYGAAYSRFYIGSNGYITFSSGDTAYDETFSDHFDRPRISALFDDLDPSAGGSIRWKQLADRVVVTYASIREYGQSTSNTFQIEMFFDGRIRVSWLGMAASDGLAGLSRGTGLPDYYTESDLSEFGGDYDEDGIPNVWEMTYFGGNTNCLANEDADNDGFSNLEEYIAGSHPNNPSSHFQITDHAHGSDGGTNYMVITWNAVEGREYSILKTYNLQYVGFDELKGGIGFPVNSYTTAVNQVYPARFYKVGVKLIEE